MRKRKSREINIFSISTLDLFASAMGVFLLIAIVALPYYLKVDPEPVDDVGKLQKMVEKLEAENRHLRDQQITTLLGLSTNAKSFVLLVDMSGSMMAYSKLMSETVNKIIDSMPADYTLQIVGFHKKSTLHNWQQPYVLSKMSDTKKKSAKAFVRSLSSKFNGATPTRLALQEGLKYNAEAIILLTDGAPSFTRPEEIVKDVTRANGGKKEIYSIALGEYRAKPILVEFLEALSKKNGGGFIGISSY